MTELEHYTALTALWVGLAWAPYIIDRVLVRGLMGALANPSPDAIPQSQWAQRAKRAHKVAIEAFLPFAVLALMAIMRAPDDVYAGTLAMIFFYGLVAHYIIYLFGIIVLRTLAFVVAVSAMGLMALHVLGVT
ncbi:putative MAPEG superfamily protein [Shimia isoporae]|uniref:Putative MAPEG superfamily protein n=1 Tax=Shimia isoporae TaxID=647720 RepID=A0A4R1N1R2_9RHOB|nr:MAPEG family protein [Shimia isoporae]TCK99997.1 putative MAPEG superfamily protein [Shimia isoporae]